MAKGSSPKHHKMSLSIVLALTECILRHILNEWLRLADVGHLDSAYCSKSARAEFVTLLSVYRVFGDRIKLSSENEYKILVWSVKRAVQVGGFTVSSELLANNTLQNALFTPSVRWIAFGEFDCGTMLDNVVAKAVKFCFNAEVLYFNCSRDESAVALCDDCYPQLAQAFRRLHTLHVQEFAMSSDGLASMLRYCKKLKTLHMLRIESPLEVALPSLEQFSALYCNIPDAVLFAIAANCSRMKHMDIFRNTSKASNEAVQAILQGCPLLEYTDVEYATSLSHELCVELARRRNFTKLGAHNKMWVNATPELVAIILRVSPNLQELVLSAQAWGTDDVLAVCAQHCRGLEYLELYSWYSVTMTGLLDITAPGNKLETVYLPLSVGFGDEAVLAVAKDCPHLKRVCCPPKVSSAIIVALAKGCPLLEHVYLANTQADDAALAALGLHCPHLRWVNVQHCAGITQQAIEGLRKQGSKLTLCI